METPPIAGPDSRADQVDTIVEQWGALRPELDLDVIEIVGRVLRSSVHLVRGSDAALAEFGLGRGEFELLSTLRRAGRPLAPGALRDATLATGPATTKRLRALEERGLVRRRPNPSDGRGSFIEATDAGRDLIDTVFPRQLDAERAMLAGVPESRRAELVASLRLLLASVERGAAGVGTDAGRA